MLRRAVASLGFALVLTFANPGSGAFASADSFIKSVGDRAFTSLGEEGISHDERTDRFRKLLRDTFDLPHIAQFVLGRYWRVATDSQKTDFVDLFEKFIVQAYVNRFQDMTGKKLHVLQAKPLTEAESLVLSEIEVQGQAPVKINWRVRKNDAFKIVDVAVEGISMSVTQRDEFAAVIRQSGGKVDGLLDALRKKTGSGKAAAEKPQ